MNLDDLHTHSEMCERIHALEAQNAALMVAISMAKKDIYKILNSGCAGWQNGGLNYLDNCVEMLEAIVQKAKSDQSDFDNRLFAEESKRLVQKAGEVMRERCAKIIDYDYSLKGGKAISALPGVTLEDLK